MFPLIFCDVFYWFLNSLKCGSYMILNVGMYLTTNDEIYMTRNVAVIWQGMSQFYCYEQAGCTWSGWFILVGTSRLGWWAPCADFGRISEIFKEGAVAGKMILGWCQIRTDARPDGQDDNGMTTSSDVKSTKLLTFICISSMRLRRNRVFVSWTVPLVPVVNGSFSRSPTAFGGISRGWLVISQDCRGPSFSVPFLRAHVADAVIDLWAFSMENLKNWKTGPTSVWRGSSLS